MPSYHQYSSFNDSGDGNGWNWSEQQIWADFAAAAAEAAEAAEQAAEEAAAAASDPAPTEDNESGGDAGVASKGDTEVDGDVGKGSSAQGPAQQIVVDTSALGPPPPGPGEREVASAFAVMADVLSGDNSCSQFFGPAGMTALAALQAVTTVAPVNESGTNQPNPNIGISTTKGGTTINAQTNVEIQTPINMTVNTAGIFFHGRDLGSPAGAVKSNTPLGQAIQVAHEIGHIARKDHRRVLVEDGGRFGRVGTILSQLNTSRVMTACMAPIQWSIFKRSFNTIPGVP